MGFYSKQPASRLGRSIVIPHTGATQFSTPFSATTQQIRVTSTLQIWATVDSTAVVTANSSATLIPANLPEFFTVSPGQVLNFISTSTSTLGFCVISEMA